MDPFLTALGAGLLGSLMIGKAAEPAQSRIAQSMENDSLIHNRVVAADALAMIGPSRPCSS